MSARKSTSAVYYEEQRRYNQAMKAYIGEEFENVRKCAKAFNLNRRNLANRLHRKASKSTRRAVNQRLTEPQELALTRYMKRLNDQCMSSDSKLVVAAVNYIIQLDDGFASPFGAN